MKHFSVKRILACLIAAVLLITLLPTTAFAVTQAQIDALRAKRDELTRQREEKQAVVDELEEQQASVLERKQAMDERNMFTLEQIQNIDEEIDLYDGMIEDKAREVDAAQKQEDDHLARYRARVRAMEENGNYGVIALILNARSLSGLLTIMDDMGDVMKSDIVLYNEYMDARKETEQVKAEYEEVRQDLDEKKDDLREEQENLMAEIAEATDLIADLAVDIESNREEYDEILAAEEKADRELAALIQQMEREREEALARQAEEAARKARESAGSGGGSGSSGGDNGGSGSGSSGGATVVGTGSFVFPVPSYSMITSRFGMRVHPITGQYRSHTGIDIAAPSGNSIVAADGGKVTLAQYYGGYGNCVMIDHGNGKITLYGHMSSIGVKVGQAVSQGQYIGAVGMTGLATGPHCHFEVYVNGNRVDPEQYFSGLVFSADAGV